MKATEKQIKYLKKLGIPTKGLTKQEASSIISKYYGKNVYRCRNCNGLVIEKDNTLECCGFKQRSNTSGRSIEMRRTISLGNGCISSLNGIVDYIDDGNGNEWAAWDDEDNEH